MNEQIPEFGVHRDFLTTDVLRGIVACYFETTKDREITEDELLQFNVEPVRASDYWDDRLGSIFTHNSKLVAYTQYDDVFRFEFYVNGRTADYEDPSTENGAKVRKVELEFQKRVSELLLSLSIAQNI